MKRTTYIYSLSYPEGNIRYIGKTNIPKNRIRNHIYEAKRNKWNSHKNNWIKQLLSEGNKPIFNIIEEVDYEKWEDAEIYWIAQFKAWNFDLVNKNPGGIGVKFHTDDTRKKMSEQRKGKNPGKEGNFKKGIIAHNKGKKMSEEQKEKLKKAWIKRKLIGFSEETRKKMSEGQIRRKKNKIS